MYDLPVFLAFRSSKFRGKFVAVKFVTYRARVINTWLRFYLRVQSFCSQNTFWARLCQLNCKYSLILIIINHYHFSCSKFETVDVTIVGCLLPDTTAANSSSKESDSSAVYFEESEGPAKRQKLSVESSIKVYVLNAEVCSRSETAKAHRG